MLKVATYIGMLAWVNIMKAKITHHMYKLIPCLCKKTLTCQQLQPHFSTQEQREDLRE